MKGSNLALLQIFVLHSCNSIRVWENGKEYLFKEEASIQVGTEDLQNAATGFRFLSDVKVQVNDDKLVVTIDNIQEAHYLGTYPRHSWPYRLLTDKRENERVEDQIMKSKYINSLGYENGKTFIVHLENGLAKKIELPSDVSYNGKNMMKAVASMLQVDMNERTDEDMNMWTRKELTLHGECAVSYVFTEDLTTNFREMTKSVTHLKDCRKRNFRVHDMSNSQSCNINDDDKMDGEKMFKSYGYDLSLVKEEDLLKDKMNNIYGEKLLRDIWHPAPINSGGLTTFLMEKVADTEFKLQKIFSRGVIAIRQFFGQEESVDSDRSGLTQLAIANRTMYLKEIKSLGGVESVHNPEIEETLEFKWADDKAKWNDDITVEDLKAKEASYYNGFTILDETQNDIIQGLKNYIKNYVHSMLQYNDITGDKHDIIEKLHKYNTGYMLHYMRTLNYDSLMILKDYYLDLERQAKSYQSTLTDEKHEDKIYEKDVFFDMLPWSGTWASALAIRDIVLNNDLDSDMDNAKLLISLPFHVDGVKTLVDEWYKLLESDAFYLKRQLTKSSIELSYASLVRKTCRDLETLEECYKTLKIEEFITKFESLDMDDYKLLKHYMFVFKNFRDSEVLEKKLRSIIFKKEGKIYDHEIRAMAVLALKERAIRYGIEKELFMPLLLNRDEHHEVRIAAFEAVMSGFPTSTTFAKIMLYMVWESNYEVFNYIYTAFEKYAKDVNKPCMKQIHEYAKYYLPWWKNNLWMKPKYSLGLSKTYRTFFNKEKYGYSEDIDVKIIGSHRSTIPLSIEIDWISNRFQHVTTHVLGLKLRMEGVAEKFLMIVKHMLMDHRDLNPEKLMDILKNDLKIRERKDVPAKLSILLTYSDNVVFEFYLEDSYLMTLGKWLNPETIKDMLVKMEGLTALYNLRKHSGLAMMSYSYEQPTELGVPMVFEHEAFNMLNVIGKFRKDQNLLFETDLSLKLNTVHYTKISIFHPDNKHEYMIKKNIVQRILGDTGLFMDLDWDAKRLKFAVKVPSDAMPLTRLIHARTSIKSHDNKLTRTQKYLKKSCPTCLQTQVVTKGKDYRRGGVIVPKYFYDLAKIYGMEVSGKYFDCELPESYSPGRMFWSFLKTFSPTNKEPKHILGLLISGLKQMESFLFYYPRVESCGLRFKWGPSFDQPIDRILLDIDLRDMFMEKTRLFNEIIGDRRLSLGADLIFDGVYNRTHHLDLMMKYETDFSKTKIDLEMRRQPFVYQGKLFEDFPIIFKMETWSDLKRPMLDFLKKDLLSVRSSKLLQKIDITWGKPDLKIRIDGEHMTTADAKDALRKTWYYNECVRQFDLPEWKEIEMIPKIDACYYSLVDLYTLRNYKWDIQAINLEDYMVVAYKKAGTLLKALLFPFWDFKPEYLKHELSPQQPRIRIETLFHTIEDQWDLSLELDKEVSRFNGINYGLWSWNEEPYMLLDKLRFMTSARLRPQMANYLHANKLVANCIATRATVRTFDNVTYDFKEGMDHQCYSLLSTDCTEKPTFAVFFKKDQKKEEEKKNLPLELLMYIGNEKIEIIPRERKYLRLRNHERHSLNDVTLYNQDFRNKQDFDIKINDKEYELRVGDYLLYNKDITENLINKETNNFLFRLLRSKINHNSVIIDFSPQVIVLFDGNSVQTTVGPQMKGNNCGMCGMFNNNMNIDLLDPKMCLMKDGLEMAKAWTLDKKFCSKRIAKPACDRNINKNINFENFGYKL